ncbi:MAG: RHS domain-containing protein, partial [Thermoanaerobaculales bacterium]|nr:RHS domain-containing protein [Thermoanaerobaculales bacterium]
NLRIKKITGGEVVVYIRDPAGNVLAEYDGANTLLAEYVYANERQVAKVEPGDGADSFRFFHADHLGTALVITDESGAQTWRGEYFPFGEEYSSQGTPNRYRFTQRETDQATGLSYMRARYYNPHLGRFLSVDPIGGSLGGSQSWNRYSYVLNNPVKYTDPTGAVVETVWDAANVAIGGASLVANIAAGNVGGALLDAAGLAVDVTAMATPFVPGGAGTAIKALRAADKASDGTRTVFRALRKGEDAAKGLVARAPGVGNSPASHVAGKKASQFISASKSEDVARAINSAGDNAGVVGIDLSKVGSEIVDLSGGIPGQQSGTRLDNWAKAAQEVLIKDAVPAGAIRKLE